MTKNTALKKTIQTGLIIAMALVLRQFGYMVMMGGGTGMRISPAIFISRFPAVLFGPVYGGITSGLIDILGMIIKPEGAWIPMLTLSAIIGGVLAGLMWKAVKNANTRILRKTILLIFVLVGVLGLALHVTVSFFETSAIGQFLSSLKKISFWTVGFEIISVTGLLILVLEYILRRKNSVYFGDNFIKLFAAMLTANVFVTTVNTFVLMHFIPAVAKSGFWIFYVPRLTEEVISTILQCFVMSYLLKLYNNTVKNG